jgi:hypothetical protein
MEKSRSRLNSTHKRKRSLSCLEPSGAYFFAMAVGWFWGVDVGVLSSWPSL